MSTDVILEKKVCHVRRSTVLLSMLVSRREILTVKLCYFGVDYYEYVAKKKYIHV